MSSVPTSREESELTADEAGGVWVVQCWQCYHLSRWRYQLTPPAHRCCQKKKYCHRDEINPVFYERYLGFVLERLPQIG